MAQRQSGVSKIWHCEISAIDSKATLQIGMGPIQQENTVIKHLNPAYNLIII